MKLFTNSSDQSGDLYERPKYASPKASNIKYWTHSCNFNFFHATVILIEPTIFEKMVCAQNVFKILYQNEINANFHF